MTQPAENPSLEVSEEEPPQKKAAKRGPAKARTSKATDKAKIDADAPKKARASKSTAGNKAKKAAPKKKTKNAADDSEDDGTTTGETKTSESAKPATVGEASAPRIAPAAEKPAETQSAPASERPPAPAPEPISAGARRYPVYIPRSVAKQLESEGKSAPIAVSSADELPQEIMDAVAAATAPPPRQERMSHAERRQQRYRESSPIPAAIDEMQMPPEGPLPEVAPGELGEAEGIVEISGKGFGFIRDAKRSFAQTPNDVFVTPETVRSYNLRDGQWLKGETRRGARGSQLHRLLEVNGDPPETVKNLPAFDELVVISPEQRIRLETVPDRYTTRIVDMFCPIGKGQRGLIVAPPRTGKTTLLHHIADAVVKNHPEIKLIILLVDERPEEVTDLRRTVPKAELFASSNDMDVKSHTRIAQLCIERARRLVEQGKDVFILLDSITRVGRAFNNASTGGRTGSGGLDNRALETPRRLFASARNTEEAGSLTIVATALIETNSRMDEIIFQEFKGTGNMELMLDRRIAEQRIYPAIDIFLSGTRREELLLS
ncbi:MAG: transcription termination factor Rho, partial [Chthoniobacteraceae bacterium]